MKVQLWVVGKTNESYLQQGEVIYEKRLQHYLPFQYIVLPEVKPPGKLSVEQRKLREGQTILARLETQDGLFLLDEKGLEVSSLVFSQWLDKQRQAPFKKLIFLVGGAYGFSPAVYERANGQLSLSKMTFSHQMVRLFFLEQLYRAMTILKGEPYHNEG